MYYYNDNKFEIQVEASFLERYIQAVKFYVFEQSTYSKVQYLLLSRFQLFISKEIINKKIKYIQR